MCFRVALFTDADVFAGTERHMLDLARGLRAQGADVSVACPTPAPLAEKAGAEGFRIVPVQKRGLVDRAAVETVRGLLRSGEIEIVHAHNGRTALTSALAVTLAGRGVLVATQHFLEPSHAAQTGLKGLLPGAAHRWVGRRAGRFIAISQAVRLEMERRGEAPGHKITVVPNGLVPPEASRLMPPAALRAALGIPLDAPLIACVARLEQEKDVASLVSAMAYVRAALPAAVCLVAGDGSQRAALEAQVRDASMEPHVRLLGFREDALSLINACDLFVLPSLAEPFGLVLLEAMALGKPVVTTAVGGPLEIVLPEETGLLVPPGRPEMLAQAIVRMLSQPTAMETMGKRGHLRFFGEFMATRMAQDTLAVYQEALSSQKALGRHAA